MNRNNEARRTAGGGKASYSHVPGHNTGKAAMRGGRRDAPPSFEAEEVNADAYDRRTFERNILDPAVEKRRAYAPTASPAASLDRKSAASESMGRNTTTTGRTYSHRQAPPQEDDDPHTRPGSFRVQGGSSRRGAAPERRGGGSPSSARSMPNDIDFNPQDEGGREFVPQAMAERSSAPETITVARPIPATLVEDEEAAIEARTQERVQRQSQQIANQIREELVMAQGKVPAVVGGTASVGGGGGASVTSVGRDNKDCCGCNKWLVIGLVLLALVIVGGAVGAVIVLTSSSSDDSTDRSLQTPPPTFVPIQDNTGAPTPGPSTCTLCADGTVPDGLDEMIANEEDGTTCAEFAANTGAIDGASIVCGANQALAWAACGCPTLPPPVEDPVCTLCAGGADMVGVTAGGCNDLQTMTGLVSTAYPTVLSCDAYLDAAAVADCECPEGPIVGSTPASCTLCEDGTVPVDLDTNTVSSGETCADLVLTLEEVDANDDLCDVYQAEAWLFCRCPTLPPPEEDPVCTICENGAEPTSDNDAAGLCRDYQTYAGILSSTPSSLSLPCSIYSDVAAEVGCECPVV